MAVLPDRTALGDLPSALSGRSHPNYESVTEPGKAHTAGYEALGEGSRVFGRGIERLGQGLENYAQTQQQKEDQLNLANAEGSRTIYEANLKNAIDNETDPEKIKAMLSNVGAGYESAGSNLSGNQAALWKAHSGARANELLLHGQQRLKTIEDNSFRQATQSTLNDLHDAYMKGDPQTQRDAIETAGKIYDGLVAKGMLHGDVAEREKDEWTKNAWKGLVLSKDPDTQLELLGVTKPGTIAAKDLSPTASAFLVAVSGPESAGKYNARYSPGGGATFSGFGGHPGVKEVIRNGPNAGKTSDAAGRYQFLGSTWNTIPAELRKDFTPENQDRAAWFLAQRDYKKNTGRDLEADLQKEGLTPKIMNALGGTWEAWQSAGGQSKSAALYKATLNNAPNTEDAYQVASNGMTGVLHQDDHAQMVAHAFELKKKAIADNLAIQKQQIEHSNEQYYQRLTDNKLENILEDIQNDPFLRQHPKEQNQMMEVARKRIDQLTKNKGGDYGPGFTDAREAVMSGQITTPQQLYELNQQDKLTIHGVNTLKTMIGDLRSKPEKAVEQKIITGQLAYAKGKLIGPYSFSKNSEGENLYNSTFIPAFYSRYQAWVKAGKDPYEFLSKENTDKIIKEIKPDAFTAAQNRVTAGTEDKKPVQTGPETILPPPKGVSVPQDKWNGVMQVRPNAPSGNPISLFNWSSAIRGLVNAPTAKNRAWFNQAFPGANADKILSDLGVPAQ